MEFYDEKAENFNDTYVDEGKICYAGICILLNTAINLIEEAGVETAEFVPADTHDSRNDNEYLFEEPGYISDKSDDLNGSKDNSSDLTLLASNPKRETLVGSIKINRRGNVVIYIVRKATTTQPAQTSKAKLAFSIVTRKLKLLTTKRPATKRPTTKKTISIAVRKLQPTKKSIILRATRKGAQDKTGIVNKATMKIAVRKMQPTMKHSIPIATRKGVQVKTAGKKTTAKLRVKKATIKIATKKSTIHKKTRAAQTTKMSMLTLSTKELTVETVTKTVLTGKNNETTTNDDNEPELGSFEDDDETTRKCILILSH